MAPFYLFEPIGGSCVPVTPILSRACDFDRGFRPRKFLDSIAGRAKQNAVASLLHQYLRTDLVPLESVGGNAHSARITNAGNFETPLSHVITVITIISDHNK